jgi:phosphoglycerate dehydrogenase-like enzyme
VGFTTALVTVQWEPGLIAGLERCLEAEEVVYARDSAEVGRALERAEVAIIAGDLDERYVRAPRLRWVHCDHAGLNKSARPEVFERGLLVTSSSGRSSDALAEHALFFIFNHAYRVRDVIAAQKEHRWDKEGRLPLRALRGQTLGIVGVGKTGGALALRARALGMRVLGYRRGAEPAEGVDRMYSKERGDALDELLRESDFVVLATPLTDATHHLIGARELGLMKPSAYLVNMARGSVIDEPVLIEVLRAGKIAGAGLDVFEREPLPADSPLWDLPNVLITPHSTPALADKQRRCFDVVCENVRRLRAGQPLLNQLRPDEVWTKGVAT